MSGAVAAGGVRGVSPQNEGHVSAPSSTERRTTRTRHERSECRVRVVRSGFLSRRGHTERRATRTGHERSECPVRVALRGVSNGAEMFQTKDETKLCLFTGSSERSL